MDGDVLGRIVGWMLGIEDGTLVSSGFLLSSLARRSGDVSDDTDTDADDLCRCEVESSRSG